MRMVRGLLSWMTLLALLGAPLAAIAKEGGETLYYVPKFTGFIFFQLAEQGAKKACDELGVKMVTLGTAQNDVQGYVQILQNLIPQRPQIMVTTSSDVVEELARSHGSERPRGVNEGGRVVAPRSPHLAVGSPRRCPRGPPASAPPEPRLSWGFAR